ncbi:Catenin-beta-like protein [Podospora australis]|uniref:Catenin-beta-like protein n=1 Tax=Podospora australis TaxID=1536484 RepID=A0AAN6WR62_9PEZI|nr:Catenin-beta-like protein [Podospora australis]
MTSIDEIFQKSGHSAGKRKLDPVRDPNEIYKSAKYTTNGSSRHAQVEDDNEQVDDAEAGPAPPPEDDDYGPSLPEEEEDGDDEEGRFFGGGITTQEKEILDFMDTNDLTADDAGPETIDASWLKKSSLAFEKKISKNAELRAKFENDPAKFIESEADLDAAIKALSILSDHPSLYKLFASLGCAGSLVSLLAHENTDIAIDAVEIISELTDQDVAASEEEWSSLVDALLEADLLSLLVSNFSRLDEANSEADRSGVYHALSVLENLASQPSTAETLGKDTPLLQWLLSRAQRQEKPIGQNKQYSAELLAILVQDSAPNREALIKLNAIDTLLQLIAPYRKRDPDKSNPDEEEFVENVFDTLTLLVTPLKGKEEFVKAEGVELCLIMLKEGGKKVTQPKALRLLNYAALNSLGSGLCEKIVEAGGLKPIFTLFSKKSDSVTIEHLVGIFGSMLRYLPGDTPERIRALAKFVEKDYEKIGKLVQLRREYAAKVKQVDEQFADQLASGEEDDEWFSRRLDAGFSVLQTIEVILAWLIAEDDGAKKKIQTLLADRDETLADLGKAIQAQIEGINTTTEEGKDTQEMLSTLVKFLE